MSKIEEAREALEALLRSLTGTQAEVMEAADAYGDARDLKGHVNVCKERSVSWCRKHEAFRGTTEMRWHDDRCRSPDCRNSRECDFVGGYQACGDGWYCDDGREIEELGK